MSLSDSLSHKIEHSKNVIERERNRYPTTWGVFFSGGKDSLTLLRLIGDGDRVWAKALFIDTGHQPQETYDHIKEIEKLWGVNVTVISPKKLLECGIECKEYKARVAKHAPPSSGFDVMFVGVRHDEHPARAFHPEATARWGSRRVHPILAWTEQDVWDYLGHYDVPVNPLYERGFRSLGCEDQMSLSPLPEERAGRKFDDPELMRRLRTLGYF